MAADEKLDLSLIDLTKVARPDIRVKVRRADDSEAIYRVPGNAPSGTIVELMVLFREVERADDDDLELIADLRDQIQEKVDDLFALRNADYEPGEIKLGDEELGALVQGLFQRYYASAAADAEEGGGRPTEPEAEKEPEETAAAGSSTQATPPRPRSEQRSERSSRTRRSAPSRSSTSSPT